MLSRRDVGWHQPMQHQCCASQQRGHKMTLSIIPALLNRKANVSKMSNESSSLSELIALSLILFCLLLSSTGTGYRSCKLPKEIAQIASTAIQHVYYRPGPRFYEKNFAPCSTVHKGRRVKLCFIRLSSPHQFHSSNF